MESSGSEYDKIKTGASLSISGASYTPRERIKISVTSKGLQDLLDYCKLFFSSGESSNSEAEESITPNSKVFDKSIAKRYIQTFLTHFIFVKNFIKHEHIFESSIETCIGIVTHLLNYGWEFMLGDSFYPARIPETLKSMELLMKLLRVFSRIESISNLIGKKRGIQLITMLMSTSSDHVQLQADCSATIANLASLEVNRTTILEYNSGECITLILDNMTRFSEHLTVQVEICATLANIASHEANAVFIVARKGITSILKIMRRHPDHSELLIQSYHALSSLGKSGREDLVREDFIYAVLMPNLRAHSGNQEVLSAAFHCIGSLANAAFISLSKQDSIAEAVLEAMQRFKNDAPFQVTCYFCLAHLSYNNGEMGFGEKITMEALSLIVKSMRRFPRDYSLQSTAIFAIGALAMKKEEYRLHLLEIRGIPQILSAMSAQYDLDKFMNSRRFSDDSHAWDDDSWKEDGAAPSSLQPSNPSDSLVIWETVYGEENAEMDVDSHILDSAILVSPDEAVPVAGHPGPQFATYSKSQAKIICSKPNLLQLFGCVALLNISNDAECRRQIIEYGGIDIVHKASLKVIDQMDMWLIVFCVFSKFSGNLDTRVLHTKRKAFPSLKELAMVELAELLAELRNMPRFQENGAWTRKPIFSSENSDSTYSQYKEKVSLELSDQIISLVIEDDARRGEDFPGASSTDSLESSSIPDIFNRSSRSKSSTNSGNGNPILFSETQRQNLHQSIRKLRLPFHVEGEMLGMKICQQCARFSHPRACIHELKMTTSDKSQIAYLCSTRCAKARPSFQRDPTLHYYADLSL